MYISIIPLAHSLSTTPLTYEWGDIFSDDPPPIGSIVEIQVGKHTEYGIYVGPYHGELPPGDIRQILQILWKRTVIEPYMLEIVQYVAKTYFLPIHRVMGFFLTRPLLNRLEKYGIENLLLPTREHYAGSTHKHQLIHSAKQIDTKLLETMIEPGTVVLCPDDFYLYHLEEIWRWDGAFFLPAEATDTQKSKAWIDIYHGKYSQIFWTRRILYYNLASYQKILYLEDAFVTEYMHYPTKIHYLDILRHLADTHAMNITILTTAPLLSTLHTFRDFDLINLT